MSEFLGQNIDEILEDGHPVRIYLEENRLIRELIGQISSINIEQENEKFRELFAKLCEVEKHFVRKENQLFPYLEKYGWTSPSQNMWAFHDSIREEIKTVHKAIASSDFIFLSQSLSQLFRSLEHILSVEEYRLLPNALNMLSEDDWKEMRMGDEEIGWMVEVKPLYIHPSKDTKKKRPSFFS